jgi:hypothetical protein
MADGTGSLHISTGMPRILVGKDFAMKATSLAFVLAALLVNVTSQTALAQSDDGWGSDRYSPAASSGARQYDQRGATIGVEPIRTAETNPWTIEGAQQAATDAGNSLRSSVNSGVQQMNQQGQQLADGVQNAGRDFGQQLQGMTGFNGQPSQSAATAASSGSSTARFSAPPPLASPQATTTAPPLSANNSGTITPQAWSSIRPELAPPRLATPRLASNPATPRSSTGPAFPAPPLATDTSRSLLAPPAATNTQPQEQDWSSIWGTPSSSGATATNDDASGGMIPVPPRSRASSSAQPPTTTASNASSLPAPPLDDRYRPQAPTAQPAGQGVDQWANFGQRPATTTPATTTFDPRPVPLSQPQASAAVPQNPPMQHLEQASIGMQPAAGQQTAQITPVDEVRWKPLLGVSLALAGSIGANFFLGMSYADARRRYRSLVAKTTHAFQKEAGIAA